MSRITSYGNIGSRLLGIALKEAVRRAISTIRAERFIFETTAKLGYSGELNDLVTSADKKAQQIYIKLLKECFPLCGIVAEEQNLKVRCRFKGHVVFFTVDPMDGTKAFARRQSHGIGTMLSLVVDGRVVAAYIGDVMTQEIYGFRPGKTTVHRISEFGHAEVMKINPRRKLSDQFVLLRKRPEQHSELIQSLINGKEKKAGLFRDLEVTGGSIGTSMARLWKGEVGAAILDPGYETPWDRCPIVGISQKLDFVFLRPTKNGKLQIFKPRISSKIQKIGHEVLVVHRSRLEEIRNFMRSAKLR